MPDLVPPAIAGIGLAAALCAPLVFSGIALYAVLFLIASVAISPMVGAWLGRSE